MITVALGTVCRTMCELVLLTSKGYKTLQQIADIATMKPRLSVTLFSVRLFFRECLGSSYYGMTDAYDPTIYKTTVHAAAVF